MIRIMACCSEPAIRRKQNDYPRKEGVSERGDLWRYWCWLILRWVVCVGLSHGLSVESLNSLLEIGLRCEKFTGVSK